ncbi:MAG: SDR family oxidoreductase, partial [Bacteroidales bacterium]|nr:SDR family oxidoreductase [Bacteroidales bacterium]
MKALFIGGTGTISSAITRLVAQTPGWELYLLNRGTRKNEVPQGVKTIIADINDEAAAETALAGMSFDVVCDFIGFMPAQVERDYRLFAGRTKQYMYISSASAYQKPLSSPYITEGTPLANPYWQYSRDKIACEERLMRHYREEGFPITIIRPSHTYCERGVPTAVHGNKGSWQVLKRMLEGKPVIIPGDGTTLWTVTHNSDFAKAFVGLMGNKHAIGETFQITGDENLTWNQIHEIIANILGVELKA